MLLHPVSNSRVGNKRASPWGALFVCLLVSVAGPAPAYSAQALVAPGCVADRLDETAVLATVVDGDTLRLKDGRSVRLIGINTPEIGCDGKPSEPLAVQAREDLRSLLGPAAVLGLRYGRERQDRYGRLLAHVYLADGRSVEEQLLRAGLAAHIVVPPNSGNAACYQAAEHLARTADKGVWREHYRPLPVAEVPAGARGFRVITGRVLSVGQSKKSWWLNFTPRPRKGETATGVAVRISRDDLVQFDTDRLSALPGRTIIVRGWLSPYKKQLVLRLRHPANLEVPG
ncbi:MAG: thermonuclease family protein [Gammaproteobacteria bacterium]|nr:thermonuclease family protein [Gammaproteobacteria bacterium]